jgi:hypothetical protein
MTGQRRRVILAQSRLILDDRDLLFHVWNHSLIAAVARGNRTP